MRATLLLTFLASSTFACSPGASNGGGGDDDDDDTDLADDTGDSDDTDDTDVEDTDDTDVEDTGFDTYACGWEKRDPGTLVAGEPEEGEILADLTVIDQCGESFRVWDMYGEYFILYVTAAW